MLYFIGQVFPYIAAAIFIGGMLWRLMIWLKAPVPFQLTLFPAARTTTGRIGTVMRELLLFESLRRGDKTLWLWAYLMHIALAAVIGGHIVGISTLTQQFTAFGMSPEGSSQLSAVLGTTDGMLLTVALTVLFYRRTAIPEVKQLSDPADYFDILLILAVVVSGMHMRLTTLEVDLAAIRGYLGGLITLRPVPSPENWIFISHFFLVNVLLSYFPFSKLIHITGSVVNRYMVAEPAPIYPTPTGTQRQVWLRSSLTTSEKVGVGKGGAVQ